MVYTEIEISETETIISVERTFAGKQFNLDQSDGSFSLEGSSGCCHNPPESLVSLIYPIVWTEPPSRLDARGFSVTTRHK